MRMSEQGRSLSPRSRRYIFWSHFLLAIVFIVLAWLIVLGYAVFGRQDNREAVMPWLLWSAVALTVIWPPFAVLQYRDAMRLAMHGLEVEAVIVNRRGPVQGHVRVDWQYEYKGRTYRKARSYTELALKGWAAQPTVPVLVDPRKPHVAMLREDVLFPDKTSADTWKNGSWKWWATAAGGLAAGGLAVWEYFRITDIERRGGELWIMKPFHWLYNLFGVWGPVGGYAFLAAIMLFCGIYFALQKEERPKGTT
jgi:hypothetical protein